MENNEFLYTIKPTRAELLTDGPTPEEQRVIGLHYNYLKDLTDNNIVILAGRTQNVDPTSFGIVIYKAFSAEKAKEIMENDPAVKEGIFSAKLFPFKVSLFSKK
jgi:uncharacterized protein YciI